MRWIEYLSKFDFDIQYVKGISNKVADSLSRYYQSDTWEDDHSPYDFVTADVQLDPEGEDLPWNRVVEIRAMEATPAPRRTLRETTEDREIQVRDLTSTPGPRHPPTNSTEGEDNLTIFESLSNGPELRKYVDKANGFLDKVRKGCANDLLFSK